MILYKVALKRSFSYRRRPIVVPVLKYCTFNACSILPKLTKLKAHCDAISYDVCIVETWLDSDISDAEVYISGYRVFRHDRNRHGGGVLVYVKTVCI